MCVMGEKIILLPTVFEEVVVVVEVGYLFKHGEIFSIFTVQTGIKILQSLSFGKFRKSCILSC